MVNCWSAYNECKKSTKNKIEGGGYNVQQKQKLYHAGCALQLLRQFACVPSLVPGQ